MTYCPIIMEDKFLITTGTITTQTGTENTGENAELIAIQVEPREYMIRRHGNLFSSATAIRCTAVRGTDASRHHGPQ